MLLILLREGTFLLILDCNPICITSNTMYLQAPPTVLPDQLCYVAHLIKSSTTLRIFSRENPVQGPLFQFFTNAFVFFCRMGTVGDVKFKVCIHIDKSFLIVCV